MKPSTINTILKYTTIIALFSVLFVPLIVSDSMFFLYITGKAYTFRILTEIAFALWLILAFRDRRYIPRRSWIFGAVTLFLIIVGIADVSGFEPLKSISSNYERMEGFVFIAHLFLYFVAAAGVMGQLTDKAGKILQKSRKWSFMTWSAFAHFSLLISVIMGIKGFHDHFSNGVVRIDSYLGNSTYLGVYSLIHVFLALYFFVTSLYHLTKKSENKTTEAKGVHIFSSLIYAALGIFNFLVMYQTGTRGSLIGMFFGILFVALILAIRERKNKIIRGIGIGFLSLAILAVVFLGALKNTSLVKNNQLLSRFSALVTVDLKGYASTEGRARFTIWGIALKGIQKHPILGWGQDNFNYVFNQYYNPTMYDQEPWFDRTHNVIFDWLISAGALGLLSYLGLFAALIYSIWKKEKPEYHEHSLDHPSHTSMSLAEKSVLTGLLIAYFIHNLFVFDNLSSYIGFFSILAFVHGITAHKPLLKALPSEEKPVFDPVVVDYIVVPVVVIALGFGIYFINVPGIHENTTLIDAMVQCRTGGDYAKALDLFNKALDENAYVGLQETREQAISCGGPAVADANIVQDVRQKWSVFLEKIIQDQIKATPQDARAYYFGGLYYNQIGQFDKAAEFYSKALEYSPNKQALQIQLGLVDINSNKVSDGLKLFEAAYASAPKMETARISYAAGLVYAGQGKKAEQIFGATSSVILDERVIGVYENKKEYDKAIQLYRARIAADPNDIRSAGSIAAIYFKTGNTTASIRELRALIPKFPQYKTDLEGYIAKIENGVNPFQ